MSDLANMKMSPKEAKEWAQPTAADAPEYPYGLCISLDEDGMAKLGMDNPPPVGAKLTLQAIVVVTSASAYQTQGEGPERRVELQITDMALGAAGETADQRSAKAATKLYGG